MTKRKYYKNGDPELFNYFSEDEVKDWGDHEKSMWSPYSDVEKAPIPQEVIDFQKQADPCCKEDEKKALEAKVADLEAQLKEAKTTTKIDPHDDMGQEAKPLTEDQQKKILIEELRKKGVKANMNYKLETLQKRLQDAND